MYNSLDEERVACENCIYLEKIVPRCSINNRLIIPERLRLCKDYALPLAELMKLRNKAAKRRKSS